MTLTIAVELLSISPVTSSVLGATVGGVINYGLNYHFTFASFAPHRQTLPRFLIVALLGVVLNGLLMYFGVSIMRVHYLPTQVVATIAVLAVGFLLNRVWTFGRDTGPVSLQR